MVLNLLGEGLLGVFKSVLTGYVEVLLDGEFLEGFGVLLSISLPGGFDVLSQGDQQLSESFDGSNISFFLGELGEGFHGGLIDLDHLQSGGVL